MEDEASLGCCWFLPFLLWSFRDLLAPLDIWYHRVWLTLMGSPELQPRDTHHFISPESGLFVPNISLMTKAT